MSIKEIFEIEPKQKNVLVIIVGIIGLSFVQIYMFEKSIFDLDILQTFGISIGITVCWIILNIPSNILCFLSSVFDDKKRDRLAFENIIFMHGLFAIGWITFLTYISYEFNLTLKNFIRFSVGLTIIRSLFWFFYFNCKVHRLNKKEKPE